MTSNEKARWLIRKQRDSYENQHGNEFQQLEKRRKDILNGKKTDNDVKFEFRIVTNDEIDAKEITEFLKCDGLCKVDYERRQDDFLISGCFINLKISSFSKDDYLKYLGYLYYYSINYLCKLDFYKIKWR